MLLDDLIESSKDSCNGVIGCAMIPLRIPAWQLLHQISHRILSCKIKTLNIEFRKIWNFLKSFL